MRSPRAVARTWLLDEYLLRSERFLNLRVDIILQQNDLESKSSINNNEIASSGYHPPRNDKMKVKFQPHCHQRAEGLADDGLPSGTNATTELLRMCGYDVEVLDTGCCGMAGTFGYEAEHYELSQQVGERLFREMQRAEDGMQKWLRERAQRAGCRSGREWVWRQCIRFCW